MMTKHDSVERLDFVDALRRFAAIYVVLSSHGIDAESGTRGSSLVPFGELTP
jgi:peptidoglycan/LPS O-acetylase OafA/YrhL